MCRASASYSKRARKTVDAATRRVVGAAQCSSVRHGRDAPNSSARTWQYSQTAARARGGLQSGSVDAHVDGYWNTTRPAGPSGCRAGYLFYSVGVSAQPSDRASPPRTQSETVYYPESPTRSDAMHHVKTGLLPRAARRLPVKSSSVFFFLVAVAQLLAIDIRPS